ARGRRYGSARMAAETDALDPDQVAVRTADELAALGPPRTVRPAALRTVRVELGERSYPIRIGFDTLDGAGAAVAEITKARRAAIVSVAGVARRYAAPLERGLRAAGLRVRRLLVPDGERAKTLRHVARLYDALLDFGADRDTVVVALGRGAGGDPARCAGATPLPGGPLRPVPGA